MGEKTIFPQKPRYKEVRTTAMCDCVCVSRNREVGSICLWVRRGEDMGAFVI